MSGLFSPKTPKANKPTPINGLQVQTSSYGLPLALRYGRNRCAGQVIDYVGFRSVEHAEKQKTGGKGGPKPQTTYSYTYNVTFLLALGESVGASGAINRVWKDKEVMTLSAAGFTLFQGQPGQSAWSYMTSNYPTHALAYANTAYVAGPDIDLGASAALPNYNFDLTGLFHNATRAGAKPKDIVTDYLTNAQHGAGFNFLGTLTTFDNYCLARGIYLSPFEETQRPASSFLNDIAEATNSALVWTQGKLVFVPYGDEAITGTDGTYTPDLTPQYNIGPGDYRGVGENEGYVTITRKPLAEAYNHIRLEVCDKDNDYNITVVEAKDQADIDLRGLRSKSIITAHHITDPVIGRDIAQMMLQRELYVRRTFAFDLSIRFSLLDLMDYVTLDDPISGLSQQLVRIISIEEQDDGLSIEAEEVMAQAASAPRYTTQPMQGFLPDFGADPGSVNAPMLINAPSLMCPTGFELWIAASGSAAAWGGAQVWVSEDNANYTMAGYLTGPSRLGTLNATTGVYAGGSAPDNTNTVDVTITHGSLFSGTAADRDNFRTICYAESNGGEFLAYQTATLTGTLRYTLSSLARGGYGTTAGSHASTTRFARIDDNLFRLPYEPYMEGQTIYVKLCSYNVYGAAQQSLAAATAYSIVLKANTYDGPIRGVNLGGNGANQMWDEYSHFLASPLPATSLLNGAAAPSFDAVNHAIGLGGSMSFTTAGTNVSEGAHLGTSSSDYNVPLPPGKYILSAYVYVGTANHAVRLALKTNHDNTYLSGGVDIPVVDASTWTRIAVVLDLTAKTSQTAVLPFLYTNRSGVAGRVVKFDGFMLEPAIGSAITPSAWQLGAAGRLSAAAQAAANAAQADATAALATLANIASDNLLTQGEKPVVIKDRDVLIAEQTGIDAQATTYNITTEKTTYDTAVSALTTYLATLTTPTLWSNLSGDTTIVGTTFRQKFTDVYAARQTLLQKIADVVTFGNTAGAGVNLLWDEYARYLTTTAPALNLNLTTAAVVADALATGGNALQLTTTNTSNGAYCVFGASATDYNLPLAPGKYIISFYGRASVSGHQVRLVLKDDAAVNRASANISITNTTGFTRYSATVDTTASTSVNQLLYINTNMSAVSGRVVTLDRIMVEPQIGQLTTPSLFAQGNPARLAITGITNAATAQAAANAAQADATSALASITDISSDSLLTPGEKPTIIKDRDTITAEQAGIDAGADLYQVTTEKTTYDTAVSALTTYLATLTTPVLWSNLGGNTTIVGTTFRSKFTDVYAARQACLNKIASNANSLTFAPKSGSEDVMNANFEMGADIPAIGWGFTTGNSVQTYDTTTQYAGVRSLKLTASAALSGYQSTQKYACDAGDRWRAGCMAKMGNATGNCYIAIAWYTGADVLISGSLLQSTTSTSWGALAGVAAAPATTAYFRLTLACGSNGGIGEFDAIWLTRMRNLDNDIDDGSTYGRPLLSRLNAGKPWIDFSEGIHSGKNLDNIADSGTYGRVSVSDLSSNRVGLRIAGSNQRIGDQRNLPQITVGNLQSKVPTVITYTSTTTTATISVAAFTMTAGSVTVSYNATSVGTSGSGTVLYYLYLDDASYAGGAQTLVATTTALACYQNDGRVLIGSVSVIYQASGSGGGGGGGHECVTDDMFLHYTLAAGAAQVGRMIDCINLPKNGIIYPHAIEEIKHAVEPCVRLVTVGGAVLDCSESTPFDLIGGGTAFAPQMPGQRVVTDRGIDVVDSVTPIGMRAVCRISVGGVSYAAGKNALHRIYSHNTIKP